MIQESQAYPSSVRIIAGDFNQEPHLGAVTALKNSKFLIGDAVDTEKASPVNGSIVI